MVIGITPCAAWIREQTYSGRDLTDMLSVEAPTSQPFYTIEFNIILFVLCFRFYLLL